MWRSVWWQGQPQVTALLGITDSKVTDDAKHHSCPMSSFGKFWQSKFFGIDFKFILRSQTTRSLTLIFGCDQTLNFNNHSAKMCIWCNCRKTVRSNLKICIPFFLPAAQLAQYQILCLPERTSPHSSCSGLVNKRTVTNHYVLGQTSCLTFPAKPWRVRWVWQESE